MKDIMKYNKEFVEQKEYEQFMTDKYPDKKIAIVSCMDTRLTELLPAALGLKNGDAKIIKTAGAVITHPFGSVMRSLLIGIFELGIEEIMIIGHTDCGARYTDSTKMLAKMKLHGVKDHDIDMLRYCGVDFDSWLGGFQNLEMSIQKSVELVRNHPLVPEDVAIYGMIIDSVTGELKKIC